MGQALQSPHHMNDRAATMLMTTTKPTDLDRSQTLSEGRATVRALARKVCQGPVYVCHASEGFSPPPLLRDASGCAGLDLDLQMKSVLDLLGRWRGRAAAIWVDDVRLLDDAIDRGRRFVMSSGMVARDFRQELTALAVHELGHTTGQQPRLAEATPVLIEQVAAVVETAERALHGTEAPPLLPWFGHGWSWVRRTIHLFGRALDAGFDAPFVRACDTRVYKLSHPCKYWDTLSDEVERLRDISICGLWEYRPPKAFCRLWRADVRRWIDDQETVDEGLRAAIHAALSMTDTDN